MGAAFEELTSTVFEGDTFSTFFALPEAGASLADAAFLTGGAPVFRAGGAAFGGGALATGLPPLTAPFFVPLANVFFSAGFVGPLAGLALVPLAFGATLLTGAVREAFDPPTVAFLTGLADPWTPFFALAPLASALPLVDPFPAFGPVLPDDALLTATGLPGEVGFFLGDTFPAALALLEVVF